MTSIAVLGSLNADLVVQMDQFPQPGQTIVARSFTQFTGGKGANQAVTCGRMQATVSMYGALGRDVFAARLLQSLKDSNVRVDDLLHCDDTPTGMAHIWVDGAGENAIAIVPGANTRLTREYIDTVLPKLKRVSWLLLQLEVPLDAMDYLLRKLPPDTPKVILDPAPAQPLGQLFTERVLILTPNEHELQAITGLSTTTGGEIEKACRRLLDDTAAAAAICKAGSRGAYLDDGQHFRRFPGYKVRSVDSTGAGDAFNSMLAVALSENKSLEDAILLANAAGALCVMKRGAQQSLPWREDLELFIRNQNQ